MAGRVSSRAAAKCGAGVAFVTPTLPLHKGVALRRKAC